MAQLDIPMTQKKCATCRWWSGAREVVLGLGLKTKNKEGDSHGLAWKDNWWSIGGCYGGST